MMDEKKPVALKTYEIEPPVLDQCLDCAHAVIDKFEPLNCPEIVAVRTSVVTCQENHDVFAEGICDLFQAGMPQNSISLPLLG